MDSTLRDQHIAALRTDAAKAMYDRTLARCAERPMGVSPTDQDIIYDLCAAEDVCQELRADIARRGVMVESRNGRQTYKKENPALARLCRYGEYQRKIRADLGITPKRTKAQEEEEEEQADEFDAM